MKRFIILFLIVAQIAEAQNFVSFLDVDATTNTIKKTTLHKRSIIPFMMLEGMMVVEATVNDQKGHFIIDTGAPTLVINDRPSAKSDLAGRGISNGLITDEIKVRSFNWSGINKKNIAAFKVDISHLEKVSGRKLAGIIGYDILKEVELFVDYATKTVQLTPVQSERIMEEQPIAVIPFTMQAHLPVIKVKIGKKKLRLALDTASESNILDAKVSQKINAKLIDNWRMGEIQGVDQQIKSVEIADISTTQIKDLVLEQMPYLFTDLSHLKSESGLYIDGLLGYPFFRQGKMAINYKERKIYVWAKSNKTLSPLK